MKQTAWIVPLVGLSFLLLPWTSAAAPLPCVSAVATPPVDALGAGVTVATATCVSASSNVTYLSSTCVMTTLPSPLVEAGDCFSGTGQNDPEGFQAHVGLVCSPLGNGDMWCCAYDAEGNLLNCWENGIFAPPVS